MKKLCVVSVLILILSVPLIAQQKVSGSVTLTAIANDVGCGVASVQFYIDNVPLGPALSTIPYATTWDTRTATEAFHEVKATALDKSGGAMPQPGQECNGAAPNAASATVNVEVDNIPADITPPTVTITTPIAGSTITAGKIQIAAKAQDAQSEIGALQILINGQVKAYVANSPDLTYQWNTRPYKGGSVRIDAKAWDAPGNTAQQTIQVNVK